jgi:hypothetical protein
MNYFIQHLKRGGLPTVLRLRALYRRLAMLTHPDAAGTSPEQFVRVQASYEEALSFLCDKKPEKTRMTLLDDRAEVLRNLYRYALKFNGIEAELIFAVLLSQLKLYRPEIYEEMKRYELLFRNTYSTWRNHLYTYDAHHMWISAVVEMARFLSDGWSGYRKLMEGYLEGLKEKAALLDESQSQVLIRLSDWLIEEATGPRVELIYE